MNINSPSENHSAWNPGLESQLPREYLPLATIFRDENVTTTAAKAYELSDFSGLPAEELVAFRVERLIVHELLVHVTTGIAVPDGRNDEDLGKNFRGISATILNRFIAPHREELARIFEELKKSLLPGAPLALPSGHERLLESMPVVWFPASSETSQ